MLLKFITGNKNKLQEVQNLISDVEQIDIDLAEIQSLDPQEVIAAKLLEAQKQYPNQEFIVEDTSLECADLNGLPGPLIKWFLKSLGVKGLAELVSKLENNQAKAQTMVGYIDTNGDISYFSGELNGIIVMPRGDNGFGWDKIFQLENGKTLAELSLEEKNKISMRQEAVRQLQDFLEI